MKQTINTNYLRLIHHLLNFWYSYKGKLNNGYSFNSFSTDWNRDGLCHGKQREARRK